MRALSIATLKMLDLSGAVNAEAGSTRNLLPDEPGWNLLDSNAEKIAEYCRNLLKAGFQPSPQVEVPARKSGKSVRPLPYWGPIERVIYRALTDALLTSQPLLDRSPEAYLRFATAPIVYANELQAKDAPPSSQALFFFLTSPIKYVVKSDITAFYQFIDHSILGEELITRGSDFELIDALLELLAEVQGKTFGLPQLLDSSDALSEVYIDRVERALLRHGYAAWRFNDDFRVACHTYADGLNAIEALDRAARDVGLVISESKTVTVGFTNYLLDTLGKTRSDVGETISPDEVEDVVGDYQDDFGEEDVDSALSVLARAQSQDPDADIDLRNLGMDDVRLLRRAINGLAKGKDPRGLDHIIPLVIYAPSLTPSLMRYMQIVSNAHADEVGVVVDQIISTVSQNTWQQLWLIHTCQTLSLLDNSTGGSPTIRQSWVRGLSNDTSNLALRASAARALAAAGQLSSGDAVRAAEGVPGSLLMIYAAAVREAAAYATTLGSNALDKQVESMAQTSILHRILLKGS